MNFHLQFQISPFKEKINYRQSLLFMGSCFAQNIGEEMECQNFNALINPNGIVYNPASIAIALRKYISDYRIKEDDLFYANEVWNSWEHHSDFSRVSKMQTEEMINESYEDAHELLKQAEWLFITFGSAWYYTLNETGQTVSNCHKVPQKDFTKHLLTTTEIVKDYTTLFKQLAKFNYNLKIVFTVSPVRYIRDGVVENNRSKAILLEAVHQLKELYKHVFYFPAYELVIDDLRDYRFYEDDLVHPNYMAMEYVFEKFMETIFDEETKIIYKQINQLNTDLAHEPIHEQTAGYKKFVSNSIAKAKQLQAQFPFLDLSNFL